MQRNKPFNTFNEKEPDVVSVVDRNLDHREYARSLPGVIWIGDVPWQVRDRILTPLCMPHVPLRVERAEVREAVAHHKALLAVWTTDWDTAPSEWWWGCCDVPNYDLDKIESKNMRRDIKLGLRDCAVRTVDPEQFANIAYPIYRGARESYGTRVPTEAEYAETIRGIARFSGSEFWGAFVGSEMAAFAICLVTDGVVDLSSAKHDPAYNAHRPTNVLFFTICRTYLKRAALYVTNGSRTLWHPTTINEFLGRMGFRKVYCRLNVEMSLVAKAIDSSGLPKWVNLAGLQRLLPPHCARLAGFGKLMAIARSFQ